MKKEKESTTPAPRISHFWKWGFQGFCRRFVRKHFNRFRVVRDSIPDFDPFDSVTCFVNHASWWDPIVAIMLTDLFHDGRSFYAPIDAEALEKYTLFRKLGFFGVERGTVSGVRSFLQTSRSILDDPRNSLWISPSGGFNDVRQHAPFEPGLGHLAASPRERFFVPVAIEYPFWHERNPEILVMYGKPIRNSHWNLDKREWTNFFEACLGETQSALALYSIERREECFENVLTGRAGVGGLYDMLRRVRCHLKQEPYVATHQNHALTMANAMNARKRTNKYF